MRNNINNSWTLGLEHDIMKAGIPKHLLNIHLKQEERDCNFRRWVLWANGMDRAASMGCPFNKPDKQMNAIYTKDNRPALNFVGRIEFYKRDIISVLQVSCVFLKNDCFGLHHENIYLLVNLTYILHSLVWYTLFLYFFYKTRVHK